ncbi:MAG: hypothetical protein ABI995_11475 [Acidobacteriota bacterium]
MKSAAAVLLLCAGLSAHPVGNASINHYARLEPTAKGVDLTYALDFAELPSIELLQSWGLEPRVSSLSQMEAKAREQSRTWLAQLRLTSGGKPVQAEFSSASLFVGDGAGGLPILRVTVRAHIAATSDLQYEDTNFKDRAGWKEIITAGAADVTITKASHGAKDVSRALTAYPADPKFAPPQDLRASLTWTTNRR